MNKSRVLLIVMLAFLVALLLWCRLSLDDQPTVIATAPPVAELPEWATRPVVAAEAPATAAVLPVAATQAAERVTVPETVAEPVAPPGMRCPEIYAPMIKAGLPEHVMERADYIAERESKCDVTAHNYNPRTGDDSWCWVQINFYGSLRQARLDQFGLSDPSQMTDKDTCALAFVTLYRQCGLKPWFKPYGCSTPKEN